MAPADGRRPSFPPPGWPRCAARTAQGRSCRALALKGQRYCAHHSAQVRERAARRAALGLEGEGYAVRTARKGREGLDAALWEPPSVVLLDLRMPVLDGWAFLQERSGNPLLAAVPVIALSADADGELAQACAQGADAALAKHGDLDALLAMVQRLCDRNGPLQARPTSPSRQGQEAGLPGGRATVPIPGLQE